MTTPIEIDFGATEDVTPWTLRRTRTSTEVRRRSDGETIAYIFGEPAGPKLNNYRLRLVYPYKDVGDVHYSLRAAKEFARAYFRGETDG